jgi:hypothetical protein
VTARVLMALALVAALAGCGVGSVATSARVGSPASSAAAARVSAPGLRQVPACRAIPFGAQGSLANQAKVDAVVDRVRVVAEQQKVNGLSTLSVDSAALTVSVFWVGTVPTAMTALEEASSGVRIVFHSAQFTAQEMLVAQERVMAAKPETSDPTASRLVVATASGCRDGSGIRVEVADRKTGQPAASVPDSFVAAVQAHAGDVPVLVVPGSTPQPVAVAG